MLPGSLHLAKQKERWVQSGREFMARNGKELKQRRRRRQRERQKTIGLDKQNSNFARASRFFVHFFAVVARQQREST